MVQTVFVPAAVWNRITHCGELLKVFEEANNILEACVRKLNVADSFRRGKARRQDLPLRGKKSNSECWQRRYKGEQRAETI